MGYQLGKADLQSNAIASISSLPIMLHDVSINDAMHQQVTDSDLEVEVSEGEDSFSSMTPLEIIEDFEE